MEKKSVSTTNQKVNSRNRNKNKNRNLQIKARERVLAKKERLQKELENDEIELKAIIIDTPLRDNVVVVPDRPIVVEDEDDDPNFVSIDIDDVRFEESKSDEVINRFQFVEDNEEETKEEEDLEEFLAYDNVEDVPYEEVSQLERDENIETVSVDEEIVPRTTDNVDINAKRYFSFESRIILLLTVIIISFFVAGFFIFKAVTHTSNDAIIYDEVGEVEYDVCVKDVNNKYYSDKCLDEDMEYLSDKNSIKV